MPLPAVSEGLQSAGISGGISGKSELRPSTWFPYQYEDYRTYKNCISSHRDQMSEISKVLNSLPGRLYVAKIYPATQKGKFTIARQNRSLEGKLGGWLHPTDRLFVAPGAEVIIANADTGEQFLITGGTETFLVSPSRHKMCHHDAFQIADTLETRNLDIAFSVVKGAVAYLDNSKLRKSRINIVTNCSPHAVLAVRGTVFQSTATDVVVAEGDVLVYDKTLGVTKEVKEGEAYRFGSGRVLPANLSQKLLLDRLISRANDIRTSTERRPTRPTSSN